MTSFVTRFAPSPTGLLHLGHAFSALTTWGWAKEVGAKFLLRMENIDHTRCRAEFESAIDEDLAWLGLDWARPVRRQSDHLDDYAAALDMLRDRGLVYRCFKTRKEVLDDIARAPHLAPEGPEGPAYVGSPLPAGEEEELLDAGAPFAWRLNMSASLADLGDIAAAMTWREHRDDDGGDGGGETRGERADTLHRAQPQLFGDVVLGRKDSGVSYHLASVWDDAHQGVSHVIRGEDLRPAAHLHTLLQALLGLPQPVYRHHRLILGPDGKRLAKRDKAQTLRALRDSGMTPDGVRGALGFTGCAER